MGDSTERGEMIQVPYIVYEGEQARNERHIKRLVIALVVTILLLFGSNALWLSAWMQYDYVTTDDVEMKSEGSGVNNYIGNDGDISYGNYESETYKSEDKK